MGVHHLRSGRLLPQEKLLYHVAQLDITQDFLGTFYAGGDWSGKWMELKKELQKGLNRTFTDNGNSFRSCFQFVEHKRMDRLYMRVKVYNKFLALL